MATRAELVAALKAADAAGDDAGARKLAAAITNYSDENSIDLGPAPAPAEAPAAAPPPAAGMDADVPMWQRMLQPVADAGRLIGNGATLGAYDKLAGKIAPAIGGSDEAGQRAITDAARLRGGQGGSVLELGSSMLPALLTDGATAAPAAWNMAGGAFSKALASLGIAGAEGAGYGGIQAVNTDQPVGEGMLKGAGFGAGGHAVAGLLSAAGSKIGSLFGAKPPRMTVDALRTAKDQAYDAVKNAGVEYTPGTIRGMLSDMDNAAAPYPGRHDQVIAARDHIRNRLGGTNRPVSLSEVDLNRQIIGRDLNSLPDKAQQGMGLDMTRAMDDSLGRVSPLGVTARSGDPADGLDLLNQARGLNSRTEKLDEMTRLEDKAQLQADKSIHQGFDSTMKNNVAGILTNPKKMRGYTPDEEGAMREVVSGTTRQNIERQIGRLAPGGGLSLGAGGVATGIAAALGGGAPLMTAAALAPSAIGYIAKKASERGTKKSADALLDLVASGGKKAPPRSPAIGPKDKDTLGKLLMMMQLQGQR